MTRRTKLERKRRRLHWTLALVAVAGACMALAPHHAAEMIATVADWLAAVH